MHKYSETSQQRTSQIVDMPWKADKKLSPKCDNLFQIVSK